MESRIIVVDLAPILGPLNDLVGYLDKYDFDLDVMLDRCSGYLEYNDMLTVGLSAMAESIRGDLWDHGDPDWLEIERVIDGSLLVGQHVFDVFCQAGLYDESGWAGQLAFQRLRGRNNRDAIFISDPSTEGWN
ncbi:hypothetical protein PQR34_47975 [Paraburkholderia sediminicola]|uniref:hypothetical protein n=1 Tax=Paraburkholderia sediminicola TaxID=458836 RepID=UPI0038BCE43D